MLSCDAQERTTILNRLRVQDPLLFAQLLPAWEADQKLFASRGFCHSRGDWKKDIHAVAVPVRVSPRETPLAMNCTLATYRSPGERMEREVAPLLLDAVRQLETAQGLR